MNIVSSPQCIFPIIHSPLPLYRSPSAATSSTAKAGKELFDRRLLEYDANYRHILHAGSRYREELAKQVHKSVQLEHHPKDGPSAHDEEYAAEEGGDAPDAILAREESDRPRNANGEGKAREEEEVTEGKEGGIEEEQYSQEQKDAAQEEQARPYFGVVGYHIFVCSTKRGARCELSIAMPADRFALRGLAGLGVVLDTVCFGESLSRARDKLQWRRTIGTSDNW